MSKKKISMIAAIVAVVLASSFFIWRGKAPSFSGQDLHPALSVSDNFEILLIGDMGSGDGNQTSIAKAMNDYCLTHPLTAVIFLGDNFYPHGVKSVDDPQWKTTFSDQYNLDCIGKLPYYAVLGNHDYQGNTTAQIEYKGKTPEWNMPNRNFDLRFGNSLQLTMIDTNILDVCGFDQYCTIDFMLGSIKASTADFTIVLGHHPIDSSSGKYAKRNMQGRILESLLCDKAKFYIAGHSHHLEHLTSSKCAMDWFVVGGGGADLYEIKQRRKESLFAESVFGFMSLKVSPESLKFSFINSELKTLYEVERKKGETIAPASH
jgi:tartrate-resistant acid phosphatase type 5